MKTVYEPLHASQIKLPEIPPPVVDGYMPLFVPFVRTGNLIYLSGRIAKKYGKPFSGKLGQQITTAEGRQAARAPELEVVELPEAHTTEYISREWKVLPAQVAKTLTLRVADRALIVVTCGDSRLDNRPHRIGSIVES
jgi:hypothetical protein